MFIINFNTLSSLNKLFDDLSVNSKVVTVLKFLNKFRTKTLKNPGKIQNKETKSKILIYSKLNLIVSF